VSALQLRQDLRTNDQYARNISDGQAWLGTIDTALQTSVSQLNRAKDLATQANTSTNSSSPDSRAAIAAELEGIKATMVSLANTKYLGRSVFAGTSGAGPAVTTTSATDPSTGVVTNSYAWSSAGSDGTVERRIDASSTVRVDSDGKAVFGEDPSSVFSDLDALIAQVKSGGDLGDAVTALDGHLLRIRTEEASVGAREVRLDDAADATASSKVNLSQALSGVEDADLPATIVALQMQSTAYQAALGATAKVLQPSLMDFLS
jgi:flagellar hook-associated protein 3 FlgL